MRRREVLVTVLSGFGAGCLRTTGEGTPTSRNGETTSSATAVSTATVSGDDGQPTATSEDGDTGTEPPLDVEVETRWEAPYGTDKNPHIHHGTDIIVGSPKSSFARLSRADGSVVWELSVPGDHGESWTSSTLADGLVLFGGGTTFYAVDVDTGELAWQTAIPAAASPAEGTTTECVVSGGIALFSFEYTLSDGTNRAGLAGVDVATGELRWQRSHERMTDAFDSWLGVQSLSPAIGGRTIVGGWNTDFWVDIATGAIGDDASAGAKYGSVRSGDHLYLTDYDDLYAYRIANESLTEAWTFEPLGRASSRPKVADGAIYFAADDSGIYAVRNGEQQWRFQASRIIYTAPAVTDSWVWASGSDLSIIDRETGRGTTPSGVTVRPDILSGHGDTAFISSDRRTVAYSVRE